MARRNLRLGLNENPYCVPDSVKKAFYSSIYESNRYPLDLEDETIDHLAEYYGVPSENLLVTQGIDECIDHLIATHRNMRFVTVSPGFDGYESRLDVNQQCKASISRIPGHFSLDLPQVKMLNDDDFLLLANPDNPTGVYMDESGIHSVLENVGKVLLDHTYIAYAGVEEKSLIIDERRFHYFSFSKAFAMASFRFGILIGESSIIQKIRKRQWFCNIPTPILESIQAILLEKQWLRDTSNKIVEARNHLYKKMKELGFRVHNTKTNFLLVNVQEDSNLMFFLTCNDILVKDTASFGLSAHLRINVGSADENETLIACLKNYLKEHPRKQKMSATDIWNDS